jgi:hypothetical protein
MPRVRASPSVLDDLVSATAVSAALIAGMHARLVLPSSDLGVPFIAAFQKPPRPKSSVAKVSIASILVTY